MRKGTKPESPILAVCRTLEKQGEVPWNNDLLHGAIKGAEPRENSRRLNQLFLGSSKVLHTQCRSCWHKNCALGREGGIALLHGCVWLQPQAHRSAQLNPWAQPGGLRAGQRLPHLRGLGAGAERCSWDSRQGYRVTFTPPQAWEQQGQCLALRV